MGGITQFRSGFPFEVLGNSFDVNRKLGRADQVGPFRTLDPRKVRTFEVDGKTATGNFFFDPTAFRDPGDQKGSLGRNVFSGPGINLTSLSLSRSARIRDHHEVELRADMSNLFNHANFSLSTDQFASSGGFGEVYYTLPARRIQLSLRYKF